MRPESRPEFKAAQIQREADLLTNPAKTRITKARMPEHQDRVVIDLHQYREQRPYRGMTRVELEKELANLDAESDHHYKLSLEIGERAIAVAGLLNLDELASGNGLPPDAIDVANDFHNDPDGAA